MIIKKFCCNFVSTLKKKHMRNFTKESAEDVDIYELELFVRTKLGQTDFSLFESNDHGEHLDYHERPYHLRFDMSGNCDEEDGENENIQIWDLFYPYLSKYLSIRRSYNDDRAPLTPYVFKFHKGIGSLYEVNYENANDYEIEDVYCYGGFGTVRILVDLLLKFSFPHWEYIQDVLQGQNENITPEQYYASLPSIELYR